MLLPSQLAALVNEIERTPADLPTVRIPRHWRESFGMMASRHERSYAILRHFGRAWKPRS